MAPRRDQYQREDRRAKQRGDHAHRYDLAADQRAREDVGGNQKQCPAQCTGRQQAAVSGAEQQAGRVE